MAYWFVSEKGNFRQISYVLDSGAVERFSEVVTVLVDGVELGLFPARPGEKNKNCKFCDFQSMCPGDREVSWNKVRDAAGTGQLRGPDRGTERVDRRCVVTQLAFDLLATSSDENEGIGVAEGFGDKSSGPDASRAAAAAASHADAAGS